MHILVTGGGGFLGGFLISNLLDEGHQITALTRSARESHNKNLSWVEMDLAEGINAQFLPEAIDGVIHLAQSPEYRNGPSGEPHVLKVNVIALAQLLKYAENAGASRFVSASTGSVYEPFTGPMTENSLPQPTGFYGASKLAAEALSGAYTGRMAVSNLRVFFLFGPGQGNGFIGRLMDTVANSQPVTLPADGDGLVFVPTLARNTAHVFQKAFEEAWEGTYNVATPQALSVKTLAEKIGEAMNKDVVFERNDQASPAPIVPPLDKLSGCYDLENFDSIEVALKDFNFVEKHSP